MRTALLTFLLCAMPALSLAQATPRQAPPRIEIDGELSALFDALPRQEAVEFRPRLRLNFSGESDARSTTFRYRLDTTFDGLAADRRGRVRTGVVQVREAWAEVAGKRLELRAGFGRVVWGRLDEIAPTDVINPIDTTRFLLDGRTEARRAVVLVRGRVFASDDVQVEAVLVPRFRRGTFDALDEDSSPFNLVRDRVLPAVLSAAGGVDHREPDTSWSNVSGGARLSATLGRADVSAAVFRGFEGFGVITFEPDFGGGLPLPAVVGTLVERFPRFTMVGGDVEAVRGDWAIRGEVAAFVEKTFAGHTAPGTVRGRAIDAGAGFDRGAGAFRVFGAVVMHRQWSDEDPAIDRTDVTIVGSVERGFYRDRLMVRTFVVVNPVDRAAFARGVFAWDVRDNLTVDLSAGAFLGTSADTLGQFKGRDFVMGRATWHF